VDPPFNYATNGPDDAVVAIVSAAGMDGRDGGWLLLYGDDPVSASQLKLAYDEDQIGDAERGYSNIASTVMYCGGPLCH